MEALQASPDLRLAAKNDYCLGDQLFKRAVEALTDLLVLGSKRSGIGMQAAPAASST